MTITQYTTRKYKSLESCHFIKRRGIIKRSKVKNIYIYISTTEVIGSTLCSAAFIFVFMSYL